MRLLTDVLLMLCVSAVCLAALFTDWFFQPRPPDCASCGDEMDRTTALRVADNVASHVQCWECPTCGALIPEGRQGATFAASKGLQV